MDTLFQWCAVVGGIVFLGQFALSLLGGGHSDLDAPDLDISLDAPDLDVPDIDLGDGGVSAGHPPVGHSVAADVWFVGMFSLRAILAGITVFGLSGQGLAGEFAPFEQVVLALAAGFGTMYAIGWLVRKMHRLEHDGTVRLPDALNATGTVYLTVPGQNSGAGKVTVSVKGRTMEYAAVTDSGTLPTGLPVVVVGILLPETVIVSGNPDGAP